MAAAQSSYYIEKPKLFFGGLILGANFAQIDGDQYAGYDKVGWNVGGIVYVQFWEHVAASMEILYSEKGAKSNGAELTSNGLYITSYGNTLNYAEVPVMINFFDKRKSNFGVGLSYGRLASSKEYINTSPPQLYDQYQYPFKSSDLNFIFGGSLHLWKGLFLNGRFQYSLTSIRDKIPISADRSGQYNNMWTIRMMYLFM